MNLQIIPYHRLDKKKWDECILNSPNGLIYSNSAYLDAICPNWEAIVMNDYEAVMPLAWRKKWSIRYLYQPAFIQQSGIISSAAVDENTAKAFIDLAATRYRYAAITLNFGNKVVENKDIKVSTRSNFIINLENTEPGFGHKGQYLQKRLRRAEKNSLDYITDTDYASAIKLYHKLYGSRLPDFKMQDYNNFQMICQIFSAEENLMIRKVHHGKETVALVLLLHYKNRWYNMISCVTEKGKKLLANYFLYGKLLEELSGKNEILDLEGSDKPGIKFFYEKMADEHQPYPFISYNHLPKLIRLLKN